MPFVVASTTIDKIQNTHISDTPPVVPTVGQLWNDTSQEPPLLKMWNGTEWEVVHTSIKQLDPVAFEDINKMITDVISGSEQDKNKIQEAIDKANNALQQAGLNNTEITTIKQIQSEDGKKINQIQVNYNGLQQSVKDLDNKTESYHTQLSGQINDVVKEQGNLSQQIQTAESNISSVQDSQNNMNRELQTAKETISQISSKTESNTELINTVKQTSDSNSQKIVDTSGKVSIVEQTLNEQKQTIIDNTGKINQAVQDIDSANRTISNIDGRVSRVEQKADGITTTVSKVETELNNKADTSYVDNKVNNIQIGGTNLIPNTASMPTLVSWPATQDSAMTDGWQKFSNNISNMEVLPKDSDTYSIQISSGTDIVQSLLAQTDGEIQSAQFTFFDNAHHYSNANIKKISEENGIKTYLLWCQYKTVGTKFRTIDLGVISYTGTFIQFKDPMIELGNVPTSWSPAPQDKANQSDVNSISQQLQSQQTQINQKPDRTEIIASSNENPRAYFKVGTFSDGPNIGKGYVSVGADYGFFLNTNTFISDGFELSANNISAGLIKAKQPKWMIDGIKNNTIPHDFSDDRTYSSKLNLDNSANGDISLSLYPQLDTPLVSGGKYKYTPYSQLNGYSLNFQNLYWADGNVLQKSNPASITGYFDLNDTINTALRLSAGRVDQDKSDVSLYITTSAPWLQYQQGYDGVVIGRDSSNENKSALFANTLYTNRIQSGDDTDNSHIAVDDDILFRENCYNNGAYIGRKDKNYTLFCTGNDSDHKLGFYNSNGSYKGIYHNLVAVGAGNTIAFSNDLNGIDGMDNSNIGEAVIFCKSVTEKSTKKSKVLIEDSDMIDKAVDDITKINAREYYLKNDIKALDKWEEAGEPENVYQALDTESDIGLFAEDLLEFDSLRSLVKVNEDEYGNKDILGVNYSRLSIILLELCKKQNERINQLEELVAQMKIKLNQK